MQDWGRTMADWQHPSRDAKGRQFVTTSSPPLAARPIPPLVDRPSVSIRFDGGSVVATLRLDRGEHRRRSAEGIGALTSRALLHGLWLLPEGVPVPASQLPDVKLDRLRATRGCITEADHSLVRTYSPPGTVDRLTFEGPQPRSLLRRAIRSTPIFERNVVIRSQEPITIDSRTRAEALEWGVGITIACHDRTDGIVPVAAATLGVPSVYRWWVAELAYEAALYENAQLLS